MLYLIFCLTFRGYEYYDAWVWNRKKQCYVHVEKFHEIANPEVNCADKWIESTYPISFSEEVYNRYEWRRGQLVNTLSQKVESKD